MTALALSSWFEDEDPRDLRRWALAAAVVLGIHLAAIASYLYVHAPDDLGDDALPIEVDFSTDTVDQPEIAPPPEEQQVEQPPPPPPEETQTVMTPPPEEKPPPKVEEQKPQAAAQPARTKGGAPLIERSWQSTLFARLQQHKRYPSGAVARGEEGVVLLAFSVDRSGHVLEHHIVQSSGYPDLDQEVMTMITRAEPLPPFPPTMPDAELDLTVPIRFSLR